MLLLVTGKKAGHLRLTVQQDPLEIRLTGGLFRAPHLPHGNENGMEEKLF